MIFRKEALNEKDSNCNHSYIMYLPADMEKYLNIPVKNEAGEMCGKVEILVPIQKKE